MAHGTSDYWTRMIGVISMRFLDLTDTPASMNGQAGTVPEVTVAEDSLDWSAAKIDDHHARHEEGGADEVTGITAKLNDHSARHEAGGADPIKLDDLASPDDNTDLNVSTLKHGLTPKPPNDATKFLDGVGAYDTVKDSDLSTSDITTNDASTVKHGFLRKLSGDTTKFIRSDGQDSAPVTGDGTVSQTKLKTSIGTWSIELPQLAAATTDLVDYSFFPSQRSQYDGWIETWYACPLPTSLAYRLCGHNSGEGTCYWYGSYRYIAASEQHVEVYKDSMGKIVAVHITERENKNTVRIYDKDRKEILLTLETINIDNHPDFFKEGKVCKFTIDEIKKILGGD